MTHIISFPEQILHASSRLPLTFMDLNDWILVKIKGIDRVNYLQSQVTADVASITDEQHIMTAHCNASGKMLSNLRLFHREDGLAFITRRSVLDNQLQEFKKYAVFSKVNISVDTKEVLLGIAGLRARETLATLFTMLPNNKHPVVQQGITTLLHFTQPKERFLLVTDKFHIEKWIEILHSCIQLNNSNQWMALDIEAGFAIIDKKTSALFIPQATNIQILGGISFTKGCYIGQETIARVQYRGINKKTLYWLAGNANNVPKPGEVLELELSKNSWRQTGTVLSAVQLNDGTLWIQAVLNNNFTADTNLRVQNDNTSHLRIQPLYNK